MRRYTKRVARSGPPNQSAPNYIYGLRGGGGGHTAVDAILLRKRSDSKKKRESSHYVREPASEGRGGSPAVIDEPNTTNARVVKNRLTDRNKSPKCID